MYPILAIHAREILDSRGRPSYTCPMPPRQPKPKRAPHVVAIIAAIAMGVGWFAVQGDKEMLYGVVNK